MAAGCNGCHGGGGGGGMAAPLTNPIWIYGDDDDTLFRLIALGTGKLSPGDAFGKLGYRRKGSEAVIGPMPPAVAVVAACLLKGCSARLQARVIIVPHRHSRKIQWPTGFSICLCYGWP